MKNKNPRVVWITGASSGIGYALSEVFAVYGDNIIASARDQSGLKKLEKSIFSNQGICKIVPCDVQNELSVSKAVKRILKENDRIDVLINNAGVTCFKDFAETTTAEFSRAVDTNLKGVFLATKGALPSMLKSRKGLIMNIVSYITKEIYRKSAAYSASKAGVGAMMNVLRAEVRREGIGVVNVYPGAVSTPMWKPEQRKKYESQLLAPSQLAEMLYRVSIQPPSLMVEEIIIRPQDGDLHS